MSDTATAAPEADAIAATTETVEVVEVVEEDLLVEEVSIDGMCGVY
ncbi:mycofactocin precursor MftA [Kitasatospora sp. NPDC036755]